MRAGAVGDRAGQARAGQRPTWTWQDGFSQALIGSRRRGGSGARLLADREIDVFAELLIAAAIGVALILPRSEAAPVVTSFLPLVVLVVMTPVFGARVWRNLGLRPAGVRYWPLALGVPIAVAAVCYGILVVVGAGRSSPELSAPLSSAAVGVALTLVFVLSEEIGWRGFVLPRIQRLTNPAGGAVLTGLAHGLIHLPLVILTTTYSRGGDRWLVAPLIVITIAAAGVFYAWLRDSADSIWPAAIAHATGNTALMVLAGTAATLGSQPAAFLVIEGGIAVATTCVAVIVLLVGRRGVWRQRPPR